MKMKINMHTAALTGFKPVCFFICKLIGEMFTQIYRVLYGVAILLSLSGSPVWTNMAAGSQHKHLSLSLAFKFGSMNLSPQIEA